MTDSSPTPFIPVQSGPEGIRFDFNDGARIALPPGAWRVKFHDLQTGNVLFDQALQGGNVRSSKRFHVRFSLQIWKDGQSVFQHEFDATGRTVLIRMEQGGLGDHLAWIGAVAAFAAQHRCHLVCRVRTDLRALLREAYAQIRFIGPDDPDPPDLYATYKVLVFYNDQDNLFQPSDYRFVGLVHTASYILGVDPVERRPELRLADAPPIDGPYVCIATQASSQNKRWNNPHGWSEVIGFLKRHGYRVICIDRDRISGQGIVWNSIPHGAEDQTGNRPLAERALWLRHAAFFVGLSSGLSWLAWAAGTPVVLISGFTHPINEFATPYRIINWHACNSCSNDIRHRLDPTDFLWCPRHKDTNRMFECTRLITGAHVIRSIQPLLATSNARGNDEEMLFDCEAERAHAVPEPSYAGPMTHV